MASTLPPAGGDRACGREGTHLWSLTWKGRWKLHSDKEMVGFIFDGIKRTDRLPPAKAAAYIKETHRLPRQKSVPLKEPSKRWWAS
jgi:hypothetical protein